MNMNTNTNKNISDVDDDGGGWAQADEPLRIDGDDGEEGRDGWMDAAGARA